MNCLKIKINTKLDVKTGMHIGGNSSFSAIGATDSLVVKNPLDGKPIIPGSSIKGKMRSLLARAYNVDPPKRTPDESDCSEISRLFGNAKCPEFRNARLLFSDSFLDLDSSVSDINKLTEIKSENTIDRLTAEANPRKIERVVKGSKFKVNIIYQICKKPQDKEFDKEQIKNDLKILHDGFKLLEYDYLGGSGSRGYGRVEFGDFKSEYVVGNCEELTNTCLDNILNGNKLDNNKNDKKDFYEVDVESNKSDLENKDENA
ncbi:MAG: type III-A CRISPR-associated RAMP protein Csm3 [Candidatus Ancillula sp.]|jgi:CRISPR-associated protein Csm3|nr:type III-A CRISPR-associated RAMP protein Csm3 [Candidatus Ancillula sp.]